MDDPTAADGEPGFRHLYFPGFSIYSFLDVFTPEKRSEVMARPGWHVVTIWECALKAQRFTDGRTGQR